MNDCIIIQSVEFEQPSCIPRFLLKYLKILHTLHFIVVYDVRLSSNRIKCLKSWSIMKEVISFLNTIEKNQKKDVLLCCWNKYLQ